MPSARAGAPADTATQPPGSGRFVAGIHAWAVVVSVSIALGVAGRALAQTDEIQVYDGGLTDPGVLNLTLHNNYTPRGITTAEFPGAVVADESWNGVPEWAYGVTRWFEAGLYLPLYTLDKNQGWGLNGFKLRTLFATPDSDHRAFFYGSNFEFSFNAERWDPTRFCRATCIGPGERGRTLHRETSNADRNEVACGTSDGSS